MQPPLLAGQFPAATTVASEEPYLWLFSEPVKAILHSPGENKHSCPNCQWRLAKVCSFEGSGCYRRCQVPTNSVVSLKPTPGGSQAEGVLNNALLFGAGWDQCLARTSFQVTIARTKFQQCAGDVWWWCKAGGFRKKPRAGFNASGTNKTRYATANFGQVRFMFEQVGLSYCYQVAWGCPSFPSRVRGLSWQSRIVYVFSCRCGIFSKWGRAGCICEFDGSGVWRGFKCKTAGDFTTLQKDEIVALRLSHRVAKISSQNRALSGLCSSFCFQLFAVCPWELRAILLDKLDLHVLQVEAQRCPKTKSGTDIAKHSQIL